jgi:hypothetical protein
MSAKAVSGLSALGSWILVCPSFTQCGDLTSFFLYKYSTDQCGANSWFPSPLLARINAFPAVEAAMIIDLPLA